MPRAVFDHPRFKNEEAAYAWVESIVWANGRFCPHCGVIGKSGALKGKSTRVGVYKCYACRKPFTVKVGTIFEASHIPMHLWLQAIHLVCSSKKVSARTNCTASSASISKRLGSWDTGSGWQWTKAPWDRLAAKARPSKSTKPSTAARKTLPNKTGPGCSTTSLADQELRGWHQDQDPRRHPRRARRPSPFCQGRERHCRKPRAAVFW